jgi:hypothetical protein
MDIVIISSIILGTLGALSGIVAAVYALGFFEYLGGKKKPSVTPISKEALKDRILALNSPSLPYHISPAANTDFLVEWKIADAQWYGIFAREKIRKTYRAYLLLDETRYTARYWELLGTVRWGTGVPRITYQKEFFRGKVLFHKSWGVGYGLKDDLTLGKTYEYRFDIGYVRDPIQRAITDAGWEFVTVLRKKHATCAP